MLKGLEGGLKDSNKREQRSGAPSTVCLFVYLPCAIRHHQAQHAAPCVPGHRRRVCSLAESPFYVFNLAHALEP